MKTAWIWLAALVLAIAVPATGMEIGGATLPDTLTAGTRELTLNGAGLRRKFFVRVYAGGLYLTEKSDDAGAIVAADEPMAIRMHFVREGVSPENLIEAWNEGFEAATGGNTAPIRSGIDKFNGFFTEETRKDDVYDIIYTPEQGVRLYMRDRLMGVIPGLEFKRALFAIWLGEKPADESLKKGMLGR